MKAKDFIAKLDEVRTLSRSMFGTGDNAIPKESAPVTALANLLATLKGEVVRKQCVEVEFDSAGNIIVTDEIAKLQGQVAQSVAQRPSAGTALNEVGGDTFNPTAGIQVTAIPRAPTPKHPVQLDQVDEQSVADKDLFAIAGD